jgi:hypothetical protein
MNKIGNVFLLFIIIFSSCSSPKNLKSSVSYSENIISTPILFAEGILSTKQNSVFNFTFTTDGKTVYFTRRTGNEKQKIYFSNFQNNNWTAPQIASFSTDRDETPFIAPDGKALYFGSQRPIPNRESKGDFDMNIWKTVLQKGKWSEPIPLPQTINQVQIEKEEWPSSNENSIYTSDGINFYFATMLRGTKTIEIYQTKLLNEEFTKPIKVDGLFDNDNYWKSTPVISPDGNYLFFNSYEATNGKGGEDIYVSKRMDNGWSKAKNIGELVNTKAEEAAARFSNDGRYFLFAREIKEEANKDGIWNIYYMETKYLNYEKLFND